MPRLICDSVEFNLTYKQCCYVIGYILEEQHDCVNRADLFERVGTVIADFALENEVIHGQDWASFRELTDTTNKFIERYANTSLLEV